MLTIYGNRTPIRHGTALFREQVLFQSPNVNKFWNVNSSMIKTKRPLVSNAIQITTVIISKRETFQTTGCVFRFNVAYSCELGVFLCLMLLNVAYSSADPVAEFTPLEHS